MEHFLYINEIILHTTDAFQLCIIFTDVTQLSLPWRYSIIPIKLLLYLFLRYLK